MTTENTDKKATVMPDVDIYENEHNFTVFADMPGVVESDVDVDVSGDVLTICAKSSLTIPEAYSKQYSESKAVNYRRSFNLKNNVDADKIKAEIKDGVLALMLPKKEEAKPKKIEVKTSSDKKLLGLF
jgi:HSP20 family molecular chaperone IbpA